MPRAGVVATAEKLQTVPAPPKGTFSLILTILLCLPSLIGVTAFLLNLLLYRDPEEWGQISGALVGMGGIFGRPLVALAAVVGASVAFRTNVPPRILYAHLVVVGFGTIASLIFLFKLGM
jgi:hypothetical protein